MLTVWNPFAPISKEKRSDRGLTSKDYFERLFENTFNEFFSDLYPRMESSYEDENGNFSLYIDVPGMKESDLSIELVDKYLTIKGERKSRGSYYSVNQSIYIADRYNQETLKAELADGQLHLSMEARPPEIKENKKIPITIPGKQLPDKND